MAALDQYVELLLEGAAQQNLIAASTFGQVWERHIVDSWQLAALAPSGSWLDIGSGAGLPGIVIGIATGSPVMLVEPRAKRAEFLRATVSQLGLDHVTVTQSRIEQLRHCAADIVCARALAPLDRVFAMAAHLTDRQTTWVLPKGRGAIDELATARATWQGDFRLVPSRTDSHAAIVVARDVRRRSPR